MKISKIKGLIIKFSSRYMTIEDSYKIKDIDKMKTILTTALDKETHFHSNRTIQSFIDEWLVFNKIYKLFFFKKYSRNIKLSKKQSEKRRIFYKILSFPNRLKYNISNIIKSFKRKRKIKLYKQYIENHKENVKKAFEQEIKENPKIFQLGGTDLMNKLYQRVLTHDDSKYSPEEFEPYRKNFFPINQHEKEENKKAFDKAWKHHWQVNSHHWEHRQNKQSFDKNDEEQVLDVLENVIDWLAMGYKFNNRPYQYYENNKNHIILNDEEKKFLEYIIYECVDVEYINKENLNGTRE